MILNMSPGDMSEQGRRQGVCLGGGGGPVKCLATAARAQNFCASPEKFARGGGGGGPDTFFFSDFKIFSQFFS